MSGRGMSTAVQAEIVKSSFKFAHLVSLEFDGGAQYYTNYPRDVIWNGQTWISNGNFLSVSDIVESSTPEINDATVTLDGAVQANIAEALLQDYTDRVMSIYVAWFTAAGVLINSPLLIFSGRMDSFTVKEDPAKGTSTLEWKASNHFADFDRLNGRLANDASHQQRYPGDDFFKFSTSDSRVITWGITKTGSILKKGGAAKNAYLNQLEVQSTVESIPVLYGFRQIKDGLKYFTGVSKNNANDLYLIRILSEGEIEGVTEIKVDDVLYNDPRYNHPQTGQPLIKITVHRGEPGQVVDADLLADIKDWTSSKVGTDTAYVVIRLTYHPNVFSDIPEFKFQVKGKKVYDPRSGTVGYSNNPALCIRDFLTSDRYGRGLGEG